jgi:hypothetical protein
MNPNPTAWFQLIGPPSHVAETTTRAGSVMYPHHARSKRRNAVAGAMELPPPSCGRGARNALVSHPAAG